MAPAGPVLILADDLMWSTRLAGLVRAAGGDPVVVTTAPAFESAMPAARRVIVDTTTTRYDPIAAVALAAAAGRPVICVGQHDDHATRRAAISAGAERVYPYRTLAERGPATIAAWLGQEQTGSGRVDRVGAMPEPGPAHERTTPG